MMQLHLILALLSNVTLNKLKRYHIYALMNVTRKSLKSLGHEACWLWRANGFVNMTDNWMKYLLGQNYNIRVKIENPTLFKFQFHLSTAP